MLNATNCPRCGRFFTQIRSPICPACEKADEEVFQKLKVYIDENPACTMAELSQSTSISVGRITQFIREGRLEISKGMMNDITCEMCGKPVRTGRYCDKCAVEMLRRVNTMFGRVAPNTESYTGPHRMHTDRKL